VDGPPVEPVDGEAEGDTDGDTEGDTGGDEPAAAVGNPDPAGSAEASVASPTSGTTRPSRTAAAIVVLDIAPPVHAGPAGRGL
jgi:hypothetical protein